MKDISSSLHFSRIKALAFIQQAAISLYDIYEKEKDPKIQDECLQCAGELHKVAEKMNRRWKVT